MDQQTYDLATRVLEGLATPRSLTVALLLKHKEFDQIARLGVDPSNYLSHQADKYWRDAQASSFLKKFEDLPTSIDTADVALQTFWKCERECYLTNERLAPYLPDRLGGFEEGFFKDFFDEVKIETTTLLGKCPSNWAGRFGPGSTYGDRGVYTTILDKMSSDPLFTSSAWPYLVPWTGTEWAKATAALGRQPQTVRGNRFTTVPKDATKDRGICVEPSLNLFYQLGLGQVMKGRLRAWGLDLVEAQELHKRVACESSMTNVMCTVDLSNASDTVSYNLVKLVTPDHWFEVLSDLRSPFTLVEGKWVKLEKFSSMGNGFTFELETVIFACIAAVVMRRCGYVPIPGHNLHVFGDDIIVPDACYPILSKVLSFCGFTLNVTKSYAGGIAFRESCGGDYFNGQAVRPFYLKETPCEPQHFIALANGLRRSCDESVHPDRFRLLRRAWFAVLDCLPTSIRRCRGPEGLGDLCIHDSEERWITRWRSSIRRIRVYRPVVRRGLLPSWEGFGYPVQFAAALYGVPWSSGRVIVRDPPLGFKEGWVPYS